LARTNCKASVPADARYRRLIECCGGPSDIDGQLVGVSDRKGTSQTPHNSWLKRRSGGRRSLVF
jgi:hypothetical protein